MLNSLKASIPFIAGILRVSPHALYERQRALVSKGLLESKPGRGPGSGTPFSAETVAVLVISMLATDSIKDCAEKTRAVFDAPRTDTTSQNKNSFGGARTFGEALVNALTSDKHAQQVALVRVFRATYAGQILLAGRRGLLEFAPRNTRPSQEYQGMAGFYQILGGMDADGALAKIRALLQDNEKLTDEDVATTKAPAKKRSLKKG